MPSAPAAGGRQAIAGAAAAGARGGRSRAPRLVLAEYFVHEGAFFAGGGCPGLPPGRGPCPLHAAPAHPAVPRRHATGAALHTARSGGRYWPARYSAAAAAHDGRGRPA